MKKLTIILLMLIYGVSSSGMSITMHYCMSEFTDWEFSGNNSTSVCEACGMEKQLQKGCCHDEKKTVKSEKDQKSAGNFLSLIKAPAGVINTPFPDYATVYLVNRIASNPSSHAPPFFSKVPHYISNCTFRI